MIALVIAIRLNRTDRLQTLDTPFHFTDGHDSLGRTP